MIRSSKLSLKFSNPGKQKVLSVFLDEYHRVVSSFIDSLWDQKSIPRLLPKEITSSIDTWLSARMKQCAAKQASGIVRGTKKKQKQKQWAYEQLVKDGMFKKARKLKAVIDKTTVSKPEIKTICPELDSRFIQVDWESGTSFDGWITLSSIGNGLKLTLPVKKNKHFNNLEARGKAKIGIRLNSQSATFMFDIPTTSKREVGTTIGVDIGLNKVFSTSTGIQSQEDHHGWNLSKIIDRLNCRKKGSNGFRRVQTHRKNYINWSLNQLDLVGVKTLKAEKIRNLRFGVRTSKQLNRWTYTIISDKLERLCEDTGVQLLTNNPAFTSQRCSVCGWVQKASRKRTVFKCKSCGYSMDADLNASRNIGLDLCPLGTNWRSLNNRVGFYWPEIGQELIVPATQRSVVIG